MGRTGQIAQNFNNESRTSEQYNVFDEDNRLNSFDTQIVTNSQRSVLLRTTWLRQIITFVTVYAVFTEGISTEKPLAPQWTTDDTFAREEAASLNSDTDHQQLLTVNQTRVYRTREIDQIDNETLTRLHILKEYYSKYSHDFDGKSNKEDVLASWIPPTRLSGTVSYIFNFFVGVKDVVTALMSKNECLTCAAGACLLQGNVRNGKTRREIQKITYDVCVAMKLETPRVCKGVTELFSGEVVHILQRVTVGPSEICNFLLADACHDTYDPTKEWDVALPPVTKPAIVEAKILQKPESQLKVLHLSDTHFDPYYEEGTNADCNEPLCCRLTSGRAPNSQSRAGKWGDYRKCDTPKRTIENMYQHIVSTHTDIDYIIWTGDIPAHDIWNQTKEENLSILKQTVAQIIKAFPKIPVFPVIGNHESLPVNSFPPSSLVNKPEFAMDWLYDELDTQWRRWLPDSVNKTIKTGAYYSVLVRPGFRIISLNMNYCNDKNWWLLINSTDPIDELQWFVNELQTAEFNGEKVHVIGHIPPGDSECLKVWSRNYYAIIVRYESTITAQFFGHTHYDEFELFYDTQNPRRPVSIAYIGPSTTSYDRLNPGYRIYYVDGDRENSTRTVLDHETWVMDLKDANLNDKPVWQKLYSAKAVYNLPSLRPEDWNAFTNNLVKDRALFDLYYKHYWKNSPTRPTCDAECKKRMICDLRSGRSRDRKVMCPDVESKRDPGPYVNWSNGLCDGAAK